MKKHAKLKHVKNYFKAQMLTQLFTHLQTPYKEQMKIVEENLGGPLKKLENCLALRFQHRPL